MGKHATHHGQSGRIAGRYRDDDGLHDGAALGRNLHGYAQRDLQDRLPFERVYGSAKTKNAGGDDRDSSDSRVEGLRKIGVMQAWSNGGRMKIGKLLLPVLILS